LYKQKVDFKTEILKLCSNESPKPKHCVRGLDKHLKRQKDLGLKIIGYFDRINKTTEEINSLLTDDQKKVRDQKVVDRALQRHSNLQKLMIEYIQDYITKQVASLIKYNDFIIFYRHHENDISVGSLLKRHLARPIANYENLVARIDGNIKLADKILGEKYTMTAAPSKMLEAISASMKIEKNSQEEVVLSMLGAEPKFENKITSEDAEWVNPAGKN